MSQSPIVFKKSSMDLSFGGVVITVIDAVAADTGEANANLVRDRKNTSGWSTTDSTDAAGTIFQVVYEDEIDLDSLFLIGNNFKDYTVEFFDGASWTNFITVTGNSNPVNFHEFAKFTAQGIRLIITACFTVDEDKFLSQMITTERIGQFVEKPMVTHEASKNRKTLSLISGK